ncbi:hypothetical protein [Sphingobacterium cavernae]|uniref:hypothetical protein n=1 Tax=Sphingobacterium cavernae TaxID=2592657 RepID=UPI00123022EE|nr:hypothetical protein [Sphingobacterium cavernae]
MVKRTRGLIEVRNRNILSDFKTYFNKGFRPEVIYSELSKKYYIAEETISKIVCKEARKDKTTNKNINNNGKK